MDANDLLKNFRSNYFLGQHSKVMELWNENQDEKFQDNLLVSDFFLARSLVYSKQMLPNNSVQFTKKPSQQLLQITELINKFMQPLLSYDSGTIAKDQSDFDKILKKLLEIMNQSEPSFIHQTLAMYLALASNNYEYICSVDPKKFPQNQQELIYLQLVNYLQGFRTDLAEKKLKDLQQIDDEDVLTLLATAQLNMQKDKYQVVMQNLEEIKDRYGDSPKLINLRIECLMRSRQFEEAYNISEKLLQVFQSKEKLFDIKELEVCLCNNVTSSNIIGKSSSDLFAKLQQHYDKCLYMKRLQEATISFDDFCKKLSIQPQQN